MANEKPIFSHWSWWQVESTNEETAQCLLPASWRKYWLAAVERPNISLKNKKNSCNKNYSLPKLTTVTLVQQKLNTMYHCDLLMEQKWTCICFSRYTFLRKRFFWKYFIVTHCKDAIPKIRNKYSQKRNIPTFMCLWAIYIFPWSVCLFCCRKISWTERGNI